MKASSRIDGSRCGAIPLPRPSKSWPAAATAAALLLFAHTHRAAYSHAGPSARQPPARGLCVGCRGGNSIRPDRARLVPLPFQRKAGLHKNSFFQPSVPNICESHTSAAVSPAPEPEVVVPVLQKPTTQQSLSKQELLALVDSYDGRPLESVEEHLRFFRDPYLRGYDTPDGPPITLARSQQDYHFPTAEETIAPDDEVRQILWHLRFCIITRLRNSEKVDLDEIYDTYQRLPEPRMLYIPGRLRHQLLSVLGQPQKKNSKSMLRYFAVIADVKNNGISLTSGEWNAAISFASRYVGVSTEVEVEAALEIWREMEHESSIPATDVTFNILFDVASKAGNFTLAEMIYREMEARGHRPNRYHYVSLIHFFGLKLDTDGLRAAYGEMVRAGEMIDTVALNAVLSGLLRAGEEDAAERVYEKMKASVGNGEAIPVRNYATNRAITQALLMFARLGRHHPDLRERLQATAPLHPDLHTYRILVNHHGVGKGDLARVARYVDEMKYFCIPLHGAIFLALFKSFAIHGGPVGSGAAWSAQRLGSIWDAFLNALDEGAPGLEVKTWLACWALRAFARCGGRNGVLEAYDALKERWRLGYEDEQFMVDFLGGLVNR
ncbi:hypothetical protein QBC47DRAFT_289709 [Echria macrotheca]|uniref:Pentatricopeptide repeat protein n=1 Tax=Echria macrotheca TaxID=438768 RepID=A0AAJ0FHL2_9PEZI|nr:hypothetical protein QBC47DRAFT_289709 [Echria macrotheca]